jgi:membrane-bound lytic murein transglycosylase D
MGKVEVPLFMVVVALVVSACAGNNPSFVRSEIIDSHSSTAARPADLLVENKVIGIQPPTTKDKLSVQASRTRPAAVSSEKLASQIDTSSLAERRVYDRAKESTRSFPKEDRKRRLETSQQLGSDGQMASTVDTSLLFKNDDSSDEELRSLLTSDFLSQFDIPVVLNDAVQYFVRYFSTEKRKVLVNWLRRSRRYAPMIRSVLRDQGLPEDLLYLAMIESGFNPKAYSSMKACGPWQFIYETGGRYGLKVNHWVDERRDPEKSTVAAALYLKDLFNQFGNWYLAAAGYNAGEKRVERAVEKHETTDFWEISRYNTLPRETRDYIPRLVAVAIIAKDPERFGFSNMTYDEPVKTIVEKVPGGVSLATLARLAMCDLPTMHRLNPEILTGATPPGINEYLIKLPESTKKERFREGLRATLASETLLESATAYTVKRGDSIAVLLRRYKITVNDLALVNSCDETLAAKQGKVVYIPVFVKGSEGEMSEASQQTLTEEIKEPIKAVKEPRISLVSVSDRIRQEKRARLPLTRKNIRLAAISEKRTVVTELPKKSSKTTQKGRKYDVRPRPASHARSGKTAKAATRAVYHVVNKGETLSAIADRYDTSIESIREINGLKKDRVHSGMKLKISSANNLFRPAVQG